jgi:hypothetical protein
LSTALIIGITVAQFALAAVALFLAARVAAVRPTPLGDDLHMPMLTVARLLAEEDDLAYWYSLEGLAYTFCQHAGLDDVRDVEDVAHALFKASKDVRAGGLRQVKFESPNGNLVLILRQGGWLLHLTESGSFVALDECLGVLRGRLDPQPQEFGHEVEDPQEAPIH